MAEPAATQPAHPRSLAALAIHGAALASPLSLLLFRRGEIASELNLIGAMVGETIVIGVVAIIAALGVARMRNALPAGLVLFLGAIIASIGLALMAWTIEVALFIVGGVLFAIGSAPGIVLHRVLLATAPEPGARFRTMSWYWAAVAAGAGWPLGIMIVTTSSYTTVLWLCFALTLVVVAMLIPHALLHDNDTQTEPVANIADVPWVRRSLWAGFGAGLVVIAGADPAQSLLVGEWQRSPEQTAAVLGVGTLTAFAISAFGPWYHRLDRLQGSRRADAIGLQLLVAGSMVFVGALSFTYIGLVVCWAIAGGALALAAAGLDAAVFASIAPALRRRVAARQAVAAATGAAIGLLFDRVALGDANDQWRLAVLGLPLIWIGWAVRRYADSSQDLDVASAAAAASTVPRRIAGFDDESVPVLHVDQLEVAYGAVQVLFGTSLVVEPGQVVALLGTNGAGKTTLLRAISGLEPTIGGRVVYTGLDITKTRPTWRVGMGLHQIVGGEAVVGPLTVEENLRLFSHGVPRDDHQTKLDEVFALFPRLAERRAQRAETLSGGEKQMLALSKAIIVQPRLLLIDEFSLGLAPRVIGELLPVVRRIADQGAAVLLVEQSVNIALSVADYAYVIEKGEIGYEGSAADLRNQPELVQSAYLEGLSQALEQ